MVLNEREVKILEKFYYSQEIKIQDLSKKFNISERMVRYNISKINELLKFIKIKPIIKNDRGYYVFENKHPKILEMIKELEPIDKIKRIRLIKLIISYSNKKRTVEYLAKLFNVSRLTINSDIKEINEEIDIKNQKGLIIKGDKEKILNFKISILAEVINEIDTESMNDYTKIIKNVVFENITLEDFKKLKKLSEKFIDNFKLNINNKNYNLYLAKLVYIYIYIYGINNTHKTKDLLNSLEYEFIKKNIDIDETKLINMTDASIWLKSYNDFEKDYKDTINIELLSKNIIKKVASKIDIDLSDDRLLNEFLVQHLKSLVYRIKKGYKVKNVYIPKENKIIDDLYNYIIDATSIITKTLDVNIDEDEIHLIRLHFLASIERYNQKKQKPKDVVIITDLGSGSKKFLVENITSKFLVNIRYVGTLFEINKNIDINYETDIVLSTNVLNKEEFIGKKVIKINPILSEEDIKKLKEVGLKNKNNKIILNDLISIIEKHTIIKDKEQLTEDLILNFGSSIIIDKKIQEYKQDILVEKNILFDYDAENIETAVKKSLTLLEGQYTNKSYTKEVLKILKEKSIYIIRYNGVIIPHTKNRNNVFKSGISIISLKKPLILKDTLEEIDIIVTFAIEDEKNMLDEISNIITKAFTKEFKVLVANKNKKKLIQFLEKMEVSYNV